MIKIKNKQVELDNFPIEQSINLVSDTPVDKSTLHNHIILSRAIPEKGLVNLAEPYSYTLGYIKENFSTVDILFEVDGLDIKVKPKEPLKLLSDYYLTIADEVYNPSIVVNKSVSKSKSTLSVDTLLQLNTVKTLTILETSNMTGGTNTIKYSINDKSPRELDLKKKVTDSFEGIVYTFTNTVYVKDEKFIVTLDTNIKERLPSRIIKLKTVSSKSITPVEGVIPSSKIDTQAILNFYKKVEPLTENRKALPYYSAPNIFSITLPEDYTLDTTKPLKVTLKEAFNNYLLKQMDLYTPETKYTLYVVQEDNTLYIEVIYREDGDEALLVLDGEDNELPFIRSRR